MNKKRNAAFTLIEVLIVVVIMAVLAATIIPQFSTSVDDSKASQLQFNTHSLRSQIELFRVQHGGTYPAITNNLEALVKKTDAAGAVDPNGAFGPYLLDAIPINPVTNSNTVTAATAATPKKGTGWLYNAATGELWADGVAPASP
jgi:prepilin-type N-terminal cleavage/methylation domain-containing protein